MIDAEFEALKNGMIASLDQWTEELLESFCDNQQVVSAIGIIIRGLDDESKGPFTQAVARIAMVGMGSLLAKLQMRDGKLERVGI